MRFAYEKFKETRQKTYTQEEIAEKTGLTLSVVKNIENGRRKVTAEDEDLILLCSVLNARPEDYFVKETRTICFFNNKGGVGKTSLVSALASVMVSKMAKSILLVDCDQQMNLTMHYGMERSSNLDELNIFQAIANNESVKKHIRSTGYKGLDILISHYDMGNLESMAGDMPHREFRFASVLQEVKESGEYDYILCDTSPLLSATNNIVINGCDGIIIPFTPDPFSLGGIGNVVAYIEKIKEAKKFAPIKTNVEILGIIVNRNDKRLKMSAAITEVVEKLYDKEGYIFETKLPEDSSISKSQADKEPLSVSYQDSRIHVSMLEFAREVESRVEKIRW